MDKLTRTCRCNLDCKDLKLTGQNDFWIGAKDDGTYCDWAYCNACFSRFYLDGSKELIGGNVWITKEHDPENPCIHCTGDLTAMQYLQTWREANQ